MAPAGTSNELDVQNEYEENTHTHSGLRKSSKGQYCLPGINFSHEKKFFFAVTRSGVGR